MDARQMFLADHARVHASSVASAEGVNMEDMVCTGLDDSQLVTAPPGLNSIAWLIWRMARSEDVAVNSVIRGEPQVMESGDWAARIGVDERHVGTGDTASDIERFAAQVDVGALRAYRAAVGIETRAWVATADFDALDEPVGAADIAGEVGALGANAAWVDAFWEGKSRGWFLSWLAVGHHYYHLGEAEVIARSLGRPGF